MNVQKELYFKDDFTLGPSFKTSCTVRLTRKSITCESNSTNTQQRINLDDVIGAKVFQCSTGFGIDSACMHVYCYPLKEKGLFTPSRRHRVEYVFAVSDKESAAENLSTAKKWVRCIRWLLRRNSDVKLAAKHPDNPPRRKYLVLVNPFGGKGTALKLFETNVKPMLEEADVYYELNVTEHAGHAREIAENVKGVNEFECILCCSGDGIINEVITGLMSRPDWEEAIKTPLGHIPCGSGNGLCAAALHLSREPFDMTSSVFTVLTGQVWPLDIVKVQTSKPEPNYSFLAIVYGIVADVDIESEKYRFIGDFRFTMLGMKKIWEKEVFSGKLWYLPAEIDGSSVAVQLSVGSTKKGCAEQQNLEEVKLEDGHLKDGSFDDGILNGESLSYNISNCATSRSQPRGNVKNGKLDESLLKDGKLVEGLLKDGKLDESVLKDGQLDEGRLKDGNLHNGNLSDSILCNGTPANGTCTDFLPGFNEPIPESWKVIEGDFVGLLFVSTSHIGKDAICAPEKTPGDGIVYCICLNSEMSRSDLLTVLAKMETGDIVDVHGVSMVKARAFRVEPCAAPSKIFTIDGERFEWGKLQAEVCRGLGRVRCRGLTESTTDGE